MHRNKNTKRKTFKVTVCPPLPLHSASCGGVNSAYFFTALCCFATLFQVSPGAKGRDIVLCGENLFNDVFVLMSGLLSKAEVSAADPDIYKLTMSNGN